MFVLTLVPATAAAVWLGVKLGNRLAKVPPGRFGAPERAYQEALELSRASRYSESLERFEYAAPALGGDWYFETDYASTLHRFTLHVEGVDSIPVPAVRTSVQRMRLVRRCLEEMNHADQLASTEAQRVFMHRTRSNIFGVWGLPWDALSEHHIARAGARSGGDSLSRRYLDSLLDDLEYTHSMYLRRMQNPVNPDLR